ncbi:ribonuclease HII [Chloroflexota bacterium]
MKKQRIKTAYHPPNLEEEKTLLAQGYKLIAGIDEVGRGALAGPVVAAAVVLPESINFNSLTDVRDSKEINATKREFLYQRIIDIAVAVGIGIIAPQTIDSVNILNATKLAMRQAIEQLICSPDFLLIDGITIPGINIRQKGIIKGDKLCLSIACASIIAKVTRDNIMLELDNSYPGYGLASHKGYGTKHHLICLCQYGALPIHRFTFAPVREIYRLI